VSAMSAVPVHPLWSGSCRFLMMSTVVMAAAAAAVLAVGTQDARLLRLGLVAALWAALLGAFAAAQMRREARSSAEHAARLRSTYQLELEREVTARRVHTLTVERELREQAELTQRRELGELRAELAAMRANLERLGGAAPSKIGPSKIEPSKIEIVERVTLHAESTRVLPMPAQPRSIDGSGVSGTGVSDRVVSGGAGSYAPGRHDVPVGEWPHSPANGAGSHTDGRRALLAREGASSAMPAQSPTMQGQRTVDDLIAAHGGIAPTARRRRNHA
jgi:hypothetical protein